MNIIEVDYTVELMRTNRVLSCLNRRFLKSKVAWWLIVSLAVSQILLLNAELFEARIERTTQISTHQIRTVVIFTMISIPLEN